MPVSAKAFKNFSDVLGAQTATGLVEWLETVDLAYRDQLRELNELNFGRFDAKLEQRVTELDAKLEQRVTELDAKLERLVAQLDAKFERRLAELEMKFEQRFLDMELRLSELRGEVRQGLAQTRASLIAWMFGFGVTSTLALAGLMRAMLAGN